MQKFFYPAADDQINKNTGATKFPSRQLSFRSFLIGVAVAIAAGLFNPAYADWAETKANRQARSNRGSCNDRENEIRCKYLVPTLCKWQKPVGVIKKHPGYCYPSQ